MVSLLASLAVYIQHFPTGWCVYTISTIYLHKKHSRKTLVVMGLYLTFHQRLIIEILCAP